MEQLSNPSYSLPLSTGQSTENVVRDNPPHVDGPQTYCVHITSLPDNARVEYLTQKFGCALGDLVLNLQQHECWLRNIDDKSTAHQFVSKWNQMELFGTRICCQVEVERPILCWDFRVGKCQRTTCHWTHIPCNDTHCGPNCGYGHRSGVKDEKRRIRQSGK